MAEQNNSTEFEEKSEKSEKCLKLQGVCSKGAESSDVTASKLECAVCLQTCVHPVQLPCNHIFCFLCVKGTANQSKRCAMCRQEIPMDFLDHPQLVNEDELVKDIAFEDGYQWFYEGRNGWWQYDERTSCELEDAYKRENKRFELLIAGFLYIIDFESMLQMRRNDPVRRRKIKRDLASIPKKGVAGLRVSGNTQSQNRENAEGEERDSQDSTSNASINANLISPNTPVGLQNEVPFLTLQVPSNTPQSPISSSDSSNASFSETLSQEFQELHLTEGRYNIPHRHSRRQYENQESWTSDESRSSSENEV